MSIPSIYYVDFETQNEPWNTYTLGDGTKLRGKVVVLNVFKTGQYEYDVYGKPVYQFGSVTIWVVRAPKELKGQPSVPPPKLNELAMSVVADISFAPENENWNVYRLEDGTTLKVKPFITSVKRTSKFDAFGEPIYIINSQTVHETDMPKQLYRIREEQK